MTTDTAPGAYLNGEPYQGRVTGRLWAENVLTDTESAAHTHAARYSRAYPDTVVYLWPTGTGNYAVNAGHAAPERA